MKIRFSTFTRKRKVILSFSGVAAVIVLAYLCGSSHSVYHPVLFNESALSKAAQWVQAHKDPARFGAVSLPPQFAPLSFTGKAYVSDGGLIFFPRWIGRKTLFPDLLNSERNTIEGYGFSNKPLPTLESKPNGSGFRMLDFSDTSHPAILGADGPQMAVGHCLTPHWYEINSFS